MFMQLVVRILNNCSLKANGIMSNIRYLLKLKKNVI